MTVLKWIGIGIAGMFVVSSITGTIVTVVALRNQGDRQKDLLDEQRRLIARLG